MSLGRIRHDEHIRLTSKVRLVHARRPEDDDLVNALALVRTQVLPDMPGVVSAARKAVDRRYRFVAADALKGHSDLHTARAVIGGNIEHLAAEALPSRVLQCRFVIERPARVFLICDSTQN